MARNADLSIPSIDLGVAAEERYLAYALSVITARALPDVRDGLKPVQRRILYAMYQNLRLTAGTKPRKSAAVVGEVLGKYHPHGDVAAYEAMVRMAQTFALRYPLVHGEGNFGSLDGDSPAAMRYTEARLTPIAEELLRDIRSGTVDFTDNYDATLREPIVLPAAFPQLLVNGSTGIAVGMATNLPPHNLREVVKALLAMIRNPDIRTADLCKSIKAPDFPTGGEILNSAAEIREIYESGHGPIRLRGQFVTEMDSRKPRVIVTSVPYGADKSRIVEEIAGHIVSRKLPQAVDVRDESTDIVRVVIEIKPGSSPESVMAYLFKHTGLQINFHVNMTALVPTSTPGVGQPAKLNLRDLCRHFLDFRLTIVTRRLEHELRELRERLHILAGFLALFDDIDRAIAIIRGSASRQDAAQQLMAEFRLDEIQANAILETRLYQLAQLEIDKIREEQRAKKKRAGEIEKLLRDETSRWEIVRDELEEVGRKFGDARRTELSAGAELTYDAEAYVVHEPTTVVVTRDGWVKRLGEVKDPSSTRVREGDAARWILRGSTRDSVALFTNLGIAYIARATDLPATTGYGEPVQSLFGFKDGERVIAVHLIASENGEPGRWLVATRSGLGFFIRPDLGVTTKNGRRIARLKDDDEVIVATPGEGDTVTVATAKGKVLAFAADELSELAGVGRGVILMRVEAGDRVIGAVAHGRDQTPIAVDAENNERRFHAPELGHRAQSGRKVLTRFDAVALIPRP